MIAPELSPELIVNTPTPEWMQEMHNLHSNDQPYYYGQNLCMKFIRVDETILSAPLIWTTEEKRRYAPVTTHAEIALAGGLDLEKAADVGFFLLQLLKNELNIYGGKTTHRDFDENERRHTVVLMRNAVGDTYNVNPLS